MTADMTAEVLDFMAGYRSAWERLDLDAVVACYATPTCVGHLSGVSRLVDEAAKREYVAQRMEHLRAAGPLRWDALDVDVTPAGRVGAVYAVRWVCRHADGHLVEEFGDTYLLARERGRWLVLADVVHPA